MTDIKPNKLDGIKPADILKWMDYDRENGVFRWRVNRPRAQAGSIVGTIRKDGRRAIRIFGQATTAARLVWFIEYGKLPNQDVMHINGDLSDDRLSNLALGTRGTPADYLIAA